MFRGEGWAEGLVHHPDTFLDRQALYRLGKNQALENVLRDL